MECPRCDAALDRYTFGGREAVACASCGYIGVPVEHRGEVRAVESWDDALSRVGGGGRGDSVTVETTDDEIDSILEETGADGATRWYACNVCGKAFDSRSKLDGHTAVHARNGD